MLKSFNTNTHAGQLIYPFRSEFDFNGITLCAHASHNSIRCKFVYDVDQNTNKTIGFPYWYETSTQSHSTATHKNLESENPRKDQRFAETNLFRALTVSFWENSLILFVPLHRPGQAVSLHPVGR